MTSALSTTNSSASGIFASENLGGFGIAVSVSIGILLLITTLTLTSYCCTKFTTTNPPPRAHLARDDDIESGIHETTLMSYPKFLYGTESRLNGTIASSCCAICLGDYKDSDEVRQLPDCGHVFHVKCVDPWLRLRPTCPMCRTSPLPTPLAEVVPLARNREMDTSD